MKISSFVLLPLLSTARAFSSSTANCAMSATAQNYEQVVTKLREINSLEGISGLIGWDEMVSLSNADMTIPRSIILLVHCIIQPKHHTNKDTSFLSPGNASRGIFQLQSVPEDYASWCNLRETH